MFLNLRADLGLGDHRVHPLSGGHHLERRMKRLNPRAALASATASRRAARLTAGDTRRGNGTSRSSCWPLAVWTSCTAARSRRAKLRANRTSAGQSRRCTYVIFRPTSRQTNTSAESRTARVRQKISFPLAWAHHLPRIRPPTTASARVGTGPRALSGTMPFRLTNESAERRVMSSPGSRRPKLRIHFDPVRPHLRPQLTAEGVGDEYPRRLQRHVTIHAAAQ